MSSNTVPKQLKPFVKGDPRINRKGRPKTFDAARNLFQSIASEPAVDAQGNPIIINGRIATKAEIIVRSLAESTDSKKQEMFLQYAYGKVPDNVELTGKDGGPIETKDVSDVIGKLLPDPSTE